MSRRLSPAIDQTVPAGRKGLSERLARKAAAAVDRPRFFAPSYGQVPQIADRFKTTDPKGGRS